MADNQSFDSRDSGDLNPGGTACGTCGGPATVTPPSDGTIESAQPPVLREPRTTAVWQMERELRRSKAAQLRWMLQFHQDFVEEAEAPHLADYASAEARGASRELLYSLGRMVVFAREEAGRAALMYIAEAVGRSEFVVTTEYLAASRAKRRLPAVWKAFVDGRICDFRLRKIASTSEQLRTDEAINDLDEQAPVFAEAHRLGELDRWLKTFMHTAEPRAASERFARAARARRVTVTDIEDGMSLLTAILPTLSARAIQRRLEAVTRSPHHPVPHNPLIAEHTFELQQQDGFRRFIPESREPADTASTVPAAGMPHRTDLPEELSAHPGITGGYSLGEGPWGTKVAPTLHITDGPHPAERQEMESTSPSAFTLSELPTTKESGDPRTLDQRAADTFCSWMLNAETPEGIEIDAQIGIIVHEETLTGTSTQPAITRDGTAVISARHIQDLLAHQVDQLEWYQLLHSKDDDLLAIKSSGRYPPPRLRTALWFRDRTCTADGCTVPAERCDADHILPAEHGGPTTAENLQLLCRKHHRLKSRGHPMRAGDLRSEPTCPV